MSDGLVELLKQLSELEGVPGHEEEVRSFLRDRLDGVAEMETDNLGSLICRKTGTSEQPRIMVPAHMDEVGFAVKDIDDTGCLRFSPLGGWLDQNLLAHRVRVKTRRGPLTGVIGSTPPHMMPEEKRKKLIKKKKMFIDVGADDREDAEEMGVRIGDPVVPVQGFRRMTNEKFLMGKAWDDRVGCALVVELLEELQQMEHPNTVYGVGTVQEEVGTRSAETSAEAVNPDFCMVLDVGIATDVPGIEDEPEVSMGKGPVIYMLDAGTISHLKFRDYVIDVAEENDIPCQLSLIEGGSTDARAVQLHSRGVASVMFGVPTRYIHCHSGIIHEDDVRAMKKLMIEVVRGLDADRAQEVLDMS
ncbi:MAG: M42 family metallopeptidase [Planctomycetota bacterium]